MAEQHPPAEFQYWLNEGHDAAWAGDWQQAARAYRRAITHYDQDPLAYINLGLALHEMGDLHAALRAYQHALALHPGDIAALQKEAEIHARLGENIRAASSYMALADSYMRAHLPAQAVSTWQKVVRYDAMNEAAYRRLADAYRRGRRNDLAAQATLALARLHAEQNHKEDAIRLAEEALSLQPDYGPAHQLLNVLRGSPTAHPASTAMIGTATLRRGTESSRPAPSLLDFGILDDDEPDDGRDGGPSLTEAVQQRALARMAETVFEGDSVDLTVEALKAQAIDLQTRGLVEEAARTFAEVVEAGGGSSEVYYTLGTLYQTMLRFGDAIHQYRRVVEEPDYAMAAYVAIGQCYQNQGRTDEALDAFINAVNFVDIQAVDHTQADDVIRLYEGVADAYEAKGDQAQADHFINLLVEFLSNRGWEDKLRDLRARLGGADGALPDLIDTTASEMVLAAMEASAQYQEQGLVRAAIDELYWALTSAPHYLPLHRQIADLLIAGNRFEDAVTKLVTVADVYIARANPTQAIRTLRRALEVSRTDQNVRSRLIDLLVSHGEIDEALAHYLQLAEGFYQLAQPERAIEKLNDALRLAPRGSPDQAWGWQIQRRLADIYLQQLDWRRAVTAYEALYALRPMDLQVVQRLVDLYFKLGADARALSLVEQTADNLLEEEGSIAMIKFVQEQIDQRPDKVALRQLHGNVLAEVGDVEGAAETWERAVEALVREGERAQGAALLRRIIALHPRRESRYRAMLQHLMQQR